MGGKGQDRIHVSSRRSVYERCGYDCEIAGVEKSVAERAGFRHADAELFINRAGSGLSKTGHAELEKAKRLLSEKIAKTKKR